MIIYAIILVPRNLVGTSLITITLLYGVASMDLHQEMVILPTYCNFQLTCDRGQEEEAENINIWSTLSQRTAVEKLRP
jgi:hypothetical protein